MDITPRGLQCRIAMSCLAGVRHDTACELIAKAGTAERLFSLSAEELRALTGGNAKAYSETARAEAMTRAGESLRFLRDNRVRCLFAGEDGYPTRLAQCADAPAMLYALGDCDLDSPRMVGIVGTRHCTPYGLEFTRSLVADLAQMLPGVVIVSGLAYGIDVAAHEAALKAGVPTVGVVAHGLDTIYPAEHRDTAARMARAGGAIVTEYLPGTRIHRANFLARNHIVAGLCDAVVVVESGYRGGALYTARVALNYGRTVMAVPGRATDESSQGTNGLIANNAAHLITSAEGLADIMNWRTATAAEEPPRLFTPLPPEQQQVLDFITEHPDATRDDISHGLGLTLAAAAERLFQMEMAEVIVSVPGGRYTKI